MEVAPPPRAGTDFAASLLRGWLQLWVDACNEFRQWERKELIEKKPSPGTIDQHKKLVAKFISSAHILQAMMEDPDHPTGKFLPEIRGKLRQLEETRDMIHDPMSEEECDALLQKYFPDEPRPGSPA